MCDYEKNNGYLQAETGFVDPSAAEKTHILDLHFDFTLFRVVITMAENYELYLSGGEFARLVGFERKS